MAECGSDNRQRQVQRSVRLTRIEDALIRTYADQAGVSVATYMRCTSLRFPFPRAARHPTIDHEVAAQLLGKLGEAATAFRKAAACADGKAAEAAMNDLAEYRLMLFEALGRKP